MVQTQLLDAETRKLFNSFLDIVDPHRKKQDKVTILWGLYHMWVGSEFTNPNPVRALEDLKVISTQLTKKEREESDKEEIRIFWELCHKYGGVW